MPVLFSKHFFPDGTFGEADWVVMNDFLLRRYDCEDVCQFAIFNFCTEGHKKCFDWKIDLGKNWSVATEEAVVASQVLENKKRNATFKVTAVFAKKKKPVLEYMLVEPIAEYLK